MADILKNQNKESAMIFKAFDFEYQPKTLGWYLATIIVALGLIFLALWQNNFLFVVFVIIGELVIIYWANRKPTEWRIEIEINKKTIKIAKDNFEKTFNLENDFVDFGIRNSSENFKELILRRKSSLRPFLEIYFPSVKEKDIRDIVSKFLPEKEYPLSLMDSIIKFLGF